jgi:cyclopropane fatty-acyl-phospholipid synthase-like methyltransferase
MPKLDSPMHVNMLRDAAKDGQIARDGIYGLHWGDPQKDHALRRVRERFIYPYLNPDHRAIEIGPGGGRWTRYLLSFGELIAVDYNQPLLDELAKNYRAPHLRMLKNSGTDFPGIADRSINFVFSFGVFVHLDMPIIKGYLAEIRRTLAPSGNAVLQYSDKTKEWGRKNEGFSDNDPARMRAMVLAAGFRIVEEDTDSLPHSSVIRFA